MDGAWLAAAAGVLAAVVTGFVSNRNTRAQLDAALQQSSGSVDTSDARTLFEQTQRNFEQADAIRVALREDAERQGVEIQRQAEEIKRQASELQYLRAENTAMKEEVAAHAHRLDAAEEHVRKCEAELAAMRGLPPTVIGKEEPPSV